MNRKIVFVILTLVWLVLCVALRGSWVPAEQIEWLDFFASSLNVLLLLVWLFLIRYLELSHNSRRVMEYGFFIMIIAMVEDTCDEIILYTGWVNSVFGVAEALHPIGLALSAFSLGYWAVAQRKQRQEVEFERKHYKERSELDGLTKTFNRGYMDEFLAAQTNQYCIVILDIDNFKILNDTHGHSEGDRVIKALAEVLKVNVRKGVDRVFRYGGEEFVVYLQCDDIQVAAQCAEKIRSAFADLTFETSKNKVRYSKTISLGVGQLIANEDYNQLIQRADEALYKAKKTGKNQVVLDSELPLAS